MKQVYDILGNIKSHFENNEITNRVTYGDEFRIDTDKTQIMPIAHVNLMDAVYEDQVIIFKVMVICLGLVNKSTQVDSEDTFYGSDDLHDVLNTQFVAVTKFVNSLRRGDLFEDGFRLYEEPTAEMLHNLGENQLAGWGVEARIQMINDISIC